jgi:hypothetical protein
MRKWVFLMDAVLLLMALALLLIDLKIKDDIVTQAKMLQETIDGQGTKEPASIPGNISGRLLLRNDSGDATVAGEDLPEKSPEGNGRNKGSSSARRSAGNNGARVSAESE